MALFIVHTSLIGRVIGVSIKLPVIADYLLYMQILGGTDIAHSRFFPDFYQAIKSDKYIAV